MGLKRPHARSSAMMFKSFPPRRGGVLLPGRSRHAAALGISLYTASHPRALFAQNAAFNLTRRLGPRVLPGSTAPWHPELDEQIWAELQDAWKRALGRFDSLAVYQRRQAHRTGLTVLLIDDTRPLAIVKVRKSSAPLAIEQEALTAVRRAGVTTFQSPEPLGLDCVGPLSWSAQSAVFTAPHRPAFSAPAKLFDEVSAALHSVTGTSKHPAAHNDLTPWNLRVDRCGHLWLFDWEDVAAAPLGADRAYFSVTGFALSRAAMPADLSREGLEHWRSVISVRPAGSPSDERLKVAILAALNVALKVQAEKEVTNGAPVQAATPKNVQ